MVKKEELALLKSVVSQVEVVDDDQKVLVDNLVHEEHWA